MTFLESDFYVKILSVQKLSWAHNDTYVQPRPYNALSFRLIGDADFSDGSTVTHLQDGDILFMPAGVGYHLRTKAEEIIVIHFEITGRPQDCFEVLRPEHPKSFENLFTAMFEEWNGRTPGYYHKAMSVFYRLFAKLDKHFSPVASNPAYIKIKNSVEYIYRHFTDPDINISFLCNLSSISDTYFRRLFREVYGTTPLKFINDLRIDYAAELLETRYYPIETVAKKCGFEDAKYFSTCFKKAYQKTPSSLKNQL